MKNILYFKAGHHPAVIHKIMIDEIGLIYSELVIVHAIDVRKKNKGIETG